MACFEAGWLEDTNIALYFELLSQELLPNDLKGHVILLNPSVAFYVMHSSSIDNINAVLPDLSSASCIFVPINNNTNLDSTGGSHWSLLLVDCQSRTSTHYDSLNGANNAWAERASKVLGDLLFGSGGVTDVYKPMLGFSSVPSPQQVDGDSCGIIVLCLARYFILHMLSPEFKGLQDFRTLSLGDIQVDPKEARGEILDIIQSLRKKVTEEKSLNRKRTVQSLRIV
ncbi:hypothetical protein GGS20DRAFT_556440 [Poronia punctata]|nr:hypothetical protein GGS20DRAFT_556440 [Poronia punctata]